MTYNNTQDAPIGVVGLGYVGLELAVSLVKSGFTVFGIEKSESRVSEIVNLKSPVENVSDEQLSQAIDTGRFRVNSNIEVISECQAVILCVPTSLNLKNEPDLSELKTACNEVAPYLNPGSLIVNESTSFPGTLREIILPIIQEKRPDLLGKVLLGVAPERVNPGSNFELTHIPRVVSGLDESSKSRVYELYSRFCESVIVVNSPEIAEAAKILENSFRLINISFINEFNILLRQLNIDSQEVLDAAESKPYGFLRFNPSAGAGGHCIPVDPLYFQYLLSKSGLRSEFIELASRVNTDLTRNLLQMVRRRLPFTPRRVLILGVAYKEGLSDTRESPAGALAIELEQEGILFGWYDPLVTSWRASKPSSLEDEWDVALVVTAQPGLPIDSLIRKEVIVVDFTGKLTADKRVIQI